MSDGLALALPWFEVSVGWCLLVGLEPAVAASTAGLSIVIFSTAIAVNLLRGRQIECGCFGSLNDSHLTWLSVGRNVALLVSAVLTAAQPTSALPAFAVNMSTQRLNPGDGVATLVLGTVIPIGALLTQAALKAQLLTRPPQEHAA